MRKLKKAQEEMIGFVLIIVLVAIIALVFLSISLRKAPLTQESQEINNFLQSSLKVSSSCSDLSIQDLISSCYNNENCENASSCDILNSSFASILESSFLIGKEARVKSYKLSIDIENQSLNLLTLQKGISTQSIQGSYVLIPVSQENIKVKLELSY